VDEDQGVATIEEAAHIHYTEGRQPWNTAPPPRMPHGLSKRFHNYLSSMHYLARIYYFIKPLNMVMVMTFF
jgi:hypothetical protein